MTPISRRLFALQFAAPALYSGPLVWFTTGEAKVVEALTNQIIPADDAPGAVAAGVVYYIDKQLTGPLAKFAADYRNGIPLFQSACSKKTGKEFLSLSFDEQATYLRQIERESSFFRMVIDHTMQGFYGSPKHGGNRDEASWKMLGIKDVMTEDHKH